MFKGTEQGLSHFTEWSIARYLRSQEITYYHAKFKTPPLPPAIINPTMIEKLQHMLTANLCGIFTPLSSITVLVSRTKWND